MASLMVVAYHFGPFVASYGGPWDKFISPFAVFISGVDLFFVLSGFLIAGILIDQKASPNYYSTFYARRAFRLLPLYYVLLVSYILCVQLFPSFVSGLLFRNPIPLWPFWFHLQNFAMAAYDTGGPVWLGSTWSLAVEEQFYLLLPFFVRNVSVRGLGEGAIVAWFVALLLRVANEHLHYFSTVSSYVLLPTRMDCLAMGVLIACAVRGNYQLLHRWRHAWWKVAAGAAVGWLLLSYPYSYYSPWAFLAPTASSLVYGALLVAVLLFPKHALSQFLSTRPMRFFGDTSYSVYIFHPVILCLVFRWYPGGDAKLITAIDLIPLSVGLVLTFVVGLLSWKLVEQPLMRWGRRFVY